MLHFSQRLAKFDHHLLYMLCSQCAMMEQAHVLKAHSMLLSCGWQGIMFTSNVGVLGNAPKGNSQCVRVSLGTIPASALGEAQP